MAAQPALALSFPPQLRVTQISDEGPTPSFFIRYRDPVEFLTNNWNYARSADLLLNTSFLAAAHILFVQRSFTSQSQWLMEDAKRSGIPVIYETDDLMLDLPPQSGFKLSSAQKTAICRMLSMADVVTCSTAPLAERLQQHNPEVKVVENYAIPFKLEQIHAARSKTPHLAIVNTDYFKLIGAKAELFNALRDAVKSLNYRITFFGSVDSAMEQLKSKFPEKVEIVSSFIPWRRSFLAALMQRGINVALVPLECNVHHRFKSDVKFLDFASIGVPGIFNNAEIYKRVSHQQNGYLCNGLYAGWLDGLAFFANESARNQCGDETHRTAHERMLKHYATELSSIMLGVLSSAPVR
jgi:hypothetical protein